ncbi:hypothetical protein DPEC_G00371530 [Dallia pectoralis]|nr:hypothetical protein DPEC_G00371530 [Dallia pectoralis]
MDRPKSFTLCGERKLPIVARTFVAGENQHRLAISAHNEHGDTGLPALLEKHGEVFNGELGSMKNITVKLNIKPDSKPKLMKARPVPYAIRPKVEADLDALVNNKQVARSSHHEVYYSLRKTIEKLGEVFSQFGSPLQLQSDNGPQLVSQEMTTFLQKYTTCNHQGFTCITSYEKRTRTSFDHQTSDHEGDCTTSTGETSRRRGFKAKDRSLTRGETVLARNYLNGPKWFPQGHCSVRSGVSYTVQTTEDTIWKRHADQLLSSKAAPTEPTIVSGKTCYWGKISPSNHHLLEAHRHLLRTQT